jgi:hypothetical protein
VNPDLIKVTEIFLIPSSFLVAALASATTNYHKAGVSVLGLIVSVLWLVSSREAWRETTPINANQRRPARTLILVWLPIIFVVGWLLSIAVHTWLCGSPRPMAASLLQALDTEPQISLLACLHP